MKGINKGFTGLKLKVESYFVTKNGTIFLQVGHVFQVRQSHHAIK